MEILYDGYSDKILHGCRISWSERLIIGAGFCDIAALFMKEPFQIKCEAQDKVSDLKVQFQVPVKENGNLVGKQGLSG